jgi:hypothetical protein
MAAWAIVGLATGGLRGLIRTQTVTGAIGKDPRLGTGRTADQMATAHLIPSALVVATEPKVPTRMVKLAVGG